MDCLSPSLIQIVFPLILSVILGGFIGIEREYKRKEAGLQTYTLVCLGSCIFSLLSFRFFEEVFLKTGISFDPSRIIQAVAIGIGFIGAGVIFREKLSVKGLTTAAGLWVTAGIGIAIGAGFYFLAIFSSFLTVLIFSGLGFIEWKLFEKGKKE